jgi:hypothetical protein
MSRRALLKEFEDDLSRTPSGILDETEALANGPSYRSESLP